MMPNGGNLEDEWQVVDLLGSPSTSVAASFEQLFKLYRGPRFVDDLEALGNEAARSCNRIRALLPGAQPSRSISLSHRPHPVRCASLWSRL